MPIYSPTGYLDITNATLRTSNIETSNIKIGSANLFITTGNVSDEVFQFTNVTTGLVTTGNVEIGGSIIAPDGVTDIKSNLIVEGNVEAAALRLNSVSISPVYTIASGSGTIDFQGSPTSLTASANIEVGGNVIAQRFEGDGSGLTGIPPNAITGTLSQWSDGSNNDVYIASNVGIGNVHTLTSNTLQVGGNLYVRDTDSNVLTVQGNVSANYFEGDGSKLTGLVTTLESVGNIGNSTTNVIQFTNETTGFVTDANAVIGSNLTISGLTAQKIPYVDAQKVLRDSYITTTTGTTSIDSNLSVTGNMFVYGERFFIESESQLLKDPIIGLANNNVDQNIDIGILMQRPTSNVGIIHHGGTNELTLGYTQSNLTATEITNDLSQELTVNVIGNVVTQNNLSVGGTFKINTITAASSHSLAAVSNVGNTTSNVIQFTNPETSLVATGNVEVGGELVVSGNATVAKELTVTGNTTVSSNLTVSGNATVSSNLTVSGNAEVANDLNLSGLLTVGSYANAPSTTINGSMYYDTSVNKLQLYADNQWGSISGGSSSGANYYLDRTYASSYASTTNWVNGQHDVVVYSVETNISDTNLSGWYDTTTNPGRFSPQGTAHAGWYIVNWSVSLDLNGGTGGSGECFSSLHKNNTYYAWGSNHKSYNQTGVKADIVSTGSSLVYLNGSTDYIHVEFFTNIGSNVGIVNPGPHPMRFQVQKVVWYENGSQYSTSGDSVIFEANSKSPNSSIAANTDQAIFVGSIQVTVNTDTGNFFDISNGRYTPQVSGWYLVTWSVVTNVAYGPFTTVLKKNQTEWIAGSKFENTSSHFNCSTGSAMVPLNGTGDYIVLHLQTAGNSINIFPSSSYPSRFTIIKMSNL